MNKTILIVAAHPDDEVLGCGGTMSRLAHEDNCVYTMILGEGVTSRDLQRDSSKRKNELESLKNEIVSANKCLGVKDQFVYQFPDNRFDTVSLLDIIKSIEGVVEKVNPHTIFTHFEHDLNIDHQITYKAVLAATRPMEKQCVKEIYSFNILSSTEWSYPQKFTPNYFVNINKYIEHKINAMEEYRSELREYPHPRSSEGIRISGRFWGMQVGCLSAEPFIVVRKID
jgi:LmbE family N-acetylglucosaminyl deacetylase